MFRTRSDPANTYWLFIMPDFSLVPVDYQPDFGDVSLIPVDHDPFSADDMIQQARTQLESQPQRLATGAGLPNVGVPADNVEAAASGESYDPDSPNGVPGSGQPYNPSAAPMFPPDKPTVDWSRHNQRFRELKPATYTPTQHIGNTVAAALMGLGMQPYTANDLTSRVGNVLGLTPLGVAGSALDLIDAQRRGDIPGALVAAAGMTPGARGVARGVAEEAGAALRAAVKGAEVQFAQKGVKPTFSEKGFFAGRSIDDVAAALRNGTMSPDQLPLNVITRDGVTYTLNNRSLMALRRGGQQPTILNDMTGHPEWEPRLTGRLKEIGSNAGPDFVPPFRKR
jgi:hypothetical protein